MSQVAHEDRTVLFVSHNMAAVQSLCSSAILLDRGLLRATGSPDQLIARYFTSTGLDVAAALDQRTRGGNGLIRATGIRIIGLDGKELSGVISGQPAVFEISYRAKVPDLKFMASVDVGTMEGVRVTTLWSGLHNAEFRTQPSGKIYCYLDEVMLRPSSYLLNINLMNQFECFDFVRNAKVLCVDSSDLYGTGRLPSGDHGAAHVEIPLVRNS